MGNALARDKTALQNVYVLRQHILVLTMLVGHVEEQRQQKCVLLWRQYWGSVDGGGVFPHYMYLSGKSSEYTIYRIPGVP